MDTIENKLKDLILSKYKSLREFARKIEMPYSTFDTILKRGVGNANILNILKICNELNISADKLATGTLEYKKNQESNNFNLSMEETLVIKNFKKLDTEDKGKVIDYTVLLSSQDKYKEENNKVIELTKKEKQIWEEPGKEHLMPIASHDKDGEFTEEDYKHDDDLMDDEDFWK